MDDDAKTAPAALTDQDAALIALTRAGLTVRATVKHLNEHGPLTRLGRRWSQRTVHARLVALRAAGLLPPAKRHVRQPDMARRAKVVAAVEACGNVAAAAKQLGIKPARVWQVLQAEGVLPPTKKSKRIV